jgi:beta-lactamase regulating signal transducer with metallopeptidase domain
MSWCDLLYPWLAHSALISLIVLIVGSGAAIFCRQPTRRARIIELSLGGCLVAPLLGIIPGYPQWAVARWSTTIVERQDSSPLPPAKRPIQRIAERLAQETAGWKIGEPTAEKAVSESVSLPLPVHRVASRPAAETHATAFNMSSWIVTIYVLGVALGAAWWLLGIAGLARIMWTSRPVPPHCRELLGQIAGRAGDRVRLVASRHVNQPLASAWGRPVIVLPENLCGDEQSLRWCLAHEWTHVERRDFRVWLMAGLVRVLFFYHPLVWWMRRQLRLCQDYVADARAARLAPQPEDYAEFLTVRAAAGSLHPAIVALGMGFRKSELYRRVVMLVENQPIESRAPRLWSLSVTLTALVLVSAAAALMSAPKAAAQGQPAASTAKNESKPSTGNTTATDPSDPFTVKLPDGITVELLGVAENPSTDKPWWRPDGSPLAQRPYGTLHTLTNGGEGYLPREVVVSLGNLPSEPASVQLLSDPPYNAAGGGLDRPVKDGTTLTATAMSVPDKDTVTIRVGVAAGPWKTVKESPRGAEATSSSGTGIAFSHVYEKRDAHSDDTEVFVSVAHNISGPQTRVVAVGKDGREHSASSEGAGGAAGFCLLSAVFSKLALNDIAVFRLESRPYRWVEFHNVSLHPGHKTHVTAAIASPEGQAASAQPTPSEGAVPPIESAAAAKIEKTLSSPTHLEFADTPLQDVVDYLKDFHNIEVQLDTKALNDVGVKSDTPITKSLKGVSLRSALRLLLRDHGLTYTIQDEVLLITTPEEAQNHLQTAIYPVGDLVVPPNSTAETSADFDSLIDVIKTTVKPSSWDIEGGIGSISPFENNLSIVVSQTQEVHKEIEELLENLRTVSREQAKGPRPIFKLRPPDKLRPPESKPKPAAKSDEGKSPKPNQPEKPNA